MSKLVSYDSGDESTSENEEPNNASNCQGEVGKGCSSEGKSLEDEWDSFNQMIGEGVTQDTSALVSYPTPKEVSKTFLTVPDKSGKTKTLKDTAKSSSLYDPLNGSSDEDDNTKEIKSDKSCLPSKFRDTERKFKEEAEEEKQHDPLPSNSKTAKPVDRKELVNHNEKLHKRNKRDSSSDDSASPPKSKKRTSSPLRRSTRNRSKSRDRSKDRHRKHRNSRDRSSSRNRHKHRSSKSTRRSRSRSRSRHRDRGRRHEKRRSRSRSKSHRKPRTNPTKVNGPVKGSNPKNFKEQLKAMFLQTQGQTAEEIERDVQLDDKGLSMVAGGQKVTPQQAMAQTMAAMHAKVQEITGVAVPKYYNPSAINPMKYAEQIKKRKLLWSKNKEVEKDKEEVKVQAQWSGTSFVADQDGKMAAKFRKLMGIKGDEKPQSDEDLGKSTEEQRKKQEELFQQLAREYDFARMTTHTCRGVGLGFTSHNLPQS